MFINLLFATSKKSPLACTSFTHKNHEKQTRSPERPIATNKISMAQCASTIPTKKSVSFNYSVNVKNVEKLADICDMKTLSYCKRDYDSFKQRNEKTIRLMNKSSLIVHSQSTCTRGLEGKTNKGKSIKAYLRFESRDAVLLEQMIQEDAGEDDPERIAGVYQSFAREAAEEAQKLAKIDAEYVQGNVVEQTKKILYLRWSRFSAKRQPSRLRKCVGAAA